MLPRRSEQARAMVLSELRRNNPAADIDRAYMGTGNTTTATAGGPEQSEKSGFQTRDWALATEDDNHANVGRASSFFKWHPANSVGQLRYFKVQGYALL